LGVFRSLLPRSFLPPSAAGFQPFLQRIPLSVDSWIWPGQQHVFRFPPFSAPIARFFPPPSASSLFNLATYVFKDRPGLFLTFFPPLPTALSIAPFLFFLIFGARTGVPFLPGSDPTRLATLF